MKEVLTNATEAQKYVQAQTDPVQQRLLQRAYMAAIFHLVGAERLPRTDSTQRRFEPSAPFDLLFYLQVLTEVFKDKDLIKSVLAGEPVDDLW